MGKFRIRLKVQALELEIDGEREDIPVITNAVKQEFGGLLEGAEVVANGHKQLPEAPGAAAPVIDGEAVKKGRAPRKKNSGAGGEAATPIEFRHDPEKYGNPVQEWSITDKCIWMLYVLKNIAGVNEVNGAQLAATFNQYFKAAKRVHPPHVPRELSKLKIANPAPVGEDKNGWYLTTEGERQAQALIQSVQNPVTE